MAHLRAPCIPFCHEGNYTEIMETIMFNQNTCGCFELHFIMHFAVEKIFSLHLLPFALLNPIFQNRMNVS